MAQCPPHESFGWRRAYTDASILRAALWFHTDDLVDAQVLAAIALLDRAIVLAGAPGDGRLDLILDLIASIQAVCFADTVGTALPQLFSTKAHGVRTCTAAADSVPRLRAAPSFSSFVTTHSCRPFILSGYALEWPALREHAWTSKTYLRTIAGRGRQVPVEVGHDYRKDDWTQRIMDWDAFLGGVDTSPEVLYLAQHDLFKQFPALADDLVVPDYVYAALPPTHHYPEYRPPNNDQQLIMNVWIGPGAATSPAHTVRVVFVEVYLTQPSYRYRIHSITSTVSSGAIPIFNSVLMQLVVQIVGQKTVWLAPPSVTASMSAYDGDASNQIHNPASNREHAEMSNTSCLDVFAPREVTEKDHPAFWRDVVPYAMTATLQPGDALFFPAGWWHAMRSETTSFSVSMWF
jgi:hypothetical protein